VALYPAHGNGNNLVRSTNRVADERQWHLNSSRSIVLHVGRDSIPATQTELSGGDKDLAVWSFYVVDGTPLSSVWQVKLRQLQGLLSGRSCTSAFVAIAAEEASNRPPLDATEAYLQSMVRLRPYLCK
jgi:EpsI family protein